MGMGKSIKRMDMERLLKANLIAICIVCVLFAIVELIAKKMEVSIIILALGTMLVGFASLTKKKVKIDIRIAIVTLGQTVIIFVCTLILGSLVEMFALVLASAVMSGIYFKKNIILLQCALTSAISIFLMVFFFEFAFGSQGIVVGLKCLLSFNFGAFFVYLLVKWGSESIEQAVGKTKEAEQLVETVNIKVKESNEMAESQLELLVKVKECSDVVADTSSELVGVSQKLHTSISNQHDVVEELSETIKSFSAQTADTAEVAENARKSSEDTKATIELGHQEVRKMMDSMDEINSVSREISKVIKTIDDIAFQTNILALNASVEAARAGVHGKGFAVVAEEVRNLANKSATSAKNTEELVDKALTSIGRGTVVAQNTADAFDKVMSAIKDNGKMAEQIERMAAEQNLSISQIVENITTFSQSIAEATDTADESFGISNKLSGEADLLLKLANSHKV